ncbi:hypothetical protein LDVICp055 [lymphocystis disease virus-China]|uniref:Uncharacterized protein n=1 Tax=lymphocystis disease virus-China TaxID=256729 RepID=Q678F6_9VIRU|nr:hypothetical protein LDVICp055 [lymphocystis disease virus-China]AAU10901.1 hypothetical protein [lymphocystis disease virus-China]
MLYSIFNIFHCYNFTFISHCFRSGCLSYYSNKITDSKCNHFFSFNCIPIIAGNKMFKSTETSFSRNSKKIRITHIFR